MSLIRASEHDEQLLVKPLSLDLGGAAADGLASTTEATGARDQEIKWLQEALAASEFKRDQLVAAAREQARQEASAAHKRDDAVYTAMLAEGLKSALGTFEAKIEELNLCAVAMCENVLARLIGDTSEYSRLISAAVARQREALQQEAIISVIVSAADFSTQDDLNAITAKAGLPQHVVERDQTMASGSCRINLRLGFIDISLPAYHEDLQKILAEVQIGGARS